MFGGLSKKQYYWELRQFTQSHSDKFKETVALTKQYIYLFKRANPDVIVRIQEPIEKLHSWTFTQFQVLQRLNDNPRVFHWKHVYLPFRGELYLSNLENLNKNLKEQIQEGIPRRTKQLQRWLNSAIDDVLLVTSKSQESMNRQDAVLEIKTLILGRFKNYFEMKSWKGRSWQQLLDTADQEGLKMNSSYGLQLEEANNLASTLDFNNHLNIQDKLRLHSKKKKTNDKSLDSFKQNPEKKALLKYSHYS